MVLHMEESQPQQAKSSLSHMQIWCPALICPADFQYAHFQTCAVGGSD